MSRDKQIEEMALTIHKIVPIGLELSAAVATDFYEAGYRKQEWISVEERMPEKDVRVLVYIKSSRSYTRFDTDRRDGRGFVRWFNDVTHWMPLPEAPKGGAE